MALNNTKRQLSLVCEVADMDLSDPKASELVPAIHALWMDSPVLIFPGQDIGDAEHVAFARAFGELEIHPSVSHRSRAHPEIYRVSNVDEYGTILPPRSREWEYLELTWLWHSDSSFREVPSTGSILHGIELPPAGGDTLFCDLYAAYEALDKRTKQDLTGLEVAHSHDYLLTRSEGLSARTDKGDYAQLPPVLHPLVRAHPVTGRRSLYLSPHTMSGVAGMDEPQGRQLLDELIAHATQDEFVYQHQWQPHDIIMWDNRCTMHAVMPYDSVNHRRVLHRVTIAGDRAPIAAH